MIDDWCLMFNELMFNEQWAMFNEHWTKNIEQRLMIND